MAKKGYRKRTPAERARWRENQDRMEKLLEQALAELGTTREELMRRLGLARPHRGNA